MKAASPAATNPSPLRTCLIHTAKINPMTVITISITLTMAPGIGVAALPARVLR